MKRDESGNVIPKFKSGEDLEDIITGKVNGNKRRKLVLTFFTIIVLIANILLIYILLKSSSREYKSENMIEIKASLEQTCVNGKSIIIVKGNPIYERNDFGEIVKCD